MTERDLLIAALQKEDPARRRASLDDPRDSEVFLEAAEISCLRPRRSLTTFFVHMLREAPFPSPSPNSNGATSNGPSTHRSTLLRQGSHDRSRVDCRHGFAVGRPYDKSVR